MPIKPINTGNRWFEVLKAVELPSTRTMLENQVVKAWNAYWLKSYYIYVEAPWLGLFQSRHDFLQRAVRSVFGEGMMLKIEVADQEVPLEIFTDQELLDELARRLREVQS